MHESVKKVLVASRHARVHVTGYSADSASRCSRRRRAARVRHNAVSLLGNGVAARFVRGCL